MPLTIAQPRPTDPSINRSSSPELIVPTELQPTLCHRMQHACCELLGNVTSEFVTGFSWEAGSQFAANYCGSGMNPALTCSASYTGYALCSGAASCGGTMLTALTWAGFKMCLTHYRPNWWLTRICYGSEQIKEDVQNYITEEGRWTTFKRVLRETVVIGGVTFISDSAWQPIFDGLTILVNQYITSYWAAGLLSYGTAALITVTIFFIVNFLIRLAIEKFQLLQKFRRIPATEAQFSELVQMTCWDNFWITAGFFAGIFPMFQSASVLGDILCTGIQSGLGAGVGEAWAPFTDYLGRRVAINNLDEANRAMTILCNDLCNGSVLIESQPLLSNHSLHLAR